MQTQRTCKHCGASFDPSVDIEGRAKRVSGRPRAFCSMHCRTAHSNAHRGNGGEQSWPRSAHIELEICRRYLGLDSADALAERYGVASETIRRVLGRNDVPFRNRNASTPRKLYRGGRTISQYGYACVRVYPSDPFYAELKAMGSGRMDSTGAKYVPEHRLVMSRALGRAVKNHETVHHKNGIKTDNRLENLELWAAVHKSGQRVQDLIAFVVEHYPEAVRAALAGDQLSLSLF